MPGSKDKTINVNEIIGQAVKEADSFFKKQMLEKREQFHEKVHAAFILRTSYTTFGILTNQQLSWIASAYPKSRIETGNDQGASYFTIEPKF